MSDKRKVSTDALETLGAIIDASEKRDAIHLAVEPVEAAEKLFPGQDVGIADGKGSAQAEQKLGIVDPFLKEPVFPGQWFWLVVYPRQITSLRHVWSHPAFTDEPELKNPSKAESEAWLRAFIQDADCPDFDTVIEKALNNDSWSDEYLHFSGQDARGEIPAEFWVHVENFTGVAIPKDKRATEFSCSC